MNNVISKLKGHGKPHLPTGSIWRSETITSELAMLCETGEGYYIMVCLNDGIVDDNDGNGYDTKEDATKDHTLLANSPTIEIK